MNSVGLPTVVMTPSLFVVDVSSSSSSDDSSREDSPLSGRLSEDKVRETMVDGKIYLLGRCRYKQWWQNKNLKYRTVQATNTGQ